MIRLSTFIAKARAVEYGLDNIHVPQGDKKFKTNLDLYSVTDTIQSIIRIMLDVIGILAALFFLYGAFLYIMSWGNEAKAGKAKQTMVWAVIGLIIAILAQLMVNVVLTEFSNSPNQFINQPTTGPVTP